MSALARNVLVFGRLLRRMGVAVEASRSRDALAALVAVGVTTRHDVYHALRVTMVSRAGDLVTFDAAFAAFWRSAGGASGNREREQSGEVPRPGSELVEMDRVDSDRPTSESPDPDEADEPPNSDFRTWSARDALGDRDFAEVTPAELDELRRALEALDWNPGLRRTRRWTPGPGARIDLRRAWRGSLHSGELVRLPTRVRTTRPRPLVLLIDVSGSMDRYARMLLHFAHALQHSPRTVEVFLFSTRLTRVTRELARGSIDVAVSAASKRVPDWSGGTWIGEALRTFHVRWARSVLSRRPVVLLVSDGWDRGDPELLRAQVARLQRSCHRLIWLSPLLGTADYRPLTRGLVAALPFVDDFLPVRTLRNLEDLARHLTGLPAGRPLRRQVVAVQKPVDLPL